MPRSPRPWFRFYSEALESRKAQKLKPPLFKHWVNLLCLANIETPRGSLPCLEDIAFAMRPLSESAIADVLEELVALGMVDAFDGKFVMHDWDEWQPDSDVRGTKLPQNTRASTTETPLKRTPRVEESREEKETEEEPEEKRAIAPLVLPPLELNNIFMATQRMMGRPLTAVETDALRLMEQDFPEETWRYAVKEAGELNKRAIRYMQSVCARVGDGDPDEPRPDNRGQRGGGDGGAAQVDADTRAAWDHYHRSPTQYVITGPAGYGEDGEHTPAPQGIVADGRGVSDQGETQEAAELRRALPAARRPGL